MIKKPEQDAKKNIEGIEELARKVEDLTINEKANVIGLGEATHGNAEFQELKLDVLTNMMLAAMPWKWITERV